MKLRVFTYVLALTGLFVQCKKDPVIIDPIGKQEFVVYVKNEFNELEAHYALFLSDQDGKVVAYRAIPGDDTAKVVIPNVSPDNRYDCTVVKTTIVDAHGSGIRDTTVNLTTYTQLASQETINLRNLSYKQSTDLKIQFTNLSSLDSIIVSDGLTFIRPQPGNNFTGQYLLFHTGKVWMRIKINGEDHWRFMLFDQVGSEDLEATIDATLLPVILAHPKDVALPFVAAWQYQVEGIVDLAALKFFPLGDILRAPGGAVPVFNTLSIFEPITNDIFNPAPLPYDKFRLQVNGAGSPPDAYTYTSDGIYTTIPTALPAPAFDVTPSSLSNTRYSAAICSGSFDLLSFTRTRSGNPAIVWEVLAAPVNNGIATYRLPDLPKDIADITLHLQLYNFGNTVQVRAESYELYQGFEQVISQRLRNDDPLWQAKAGYVGKTR